MLFTGYILSCRGTVFPDLELLPSCANRAFTKKRTAVRSAVSSWTLDLDQNLCWFVCHNLQWHIDSSGQQHRHSPFTLWSLLSVQHYWSFHRLLVCKPFSVFSDISRRQTSDIDRLKSQNDRLTAPPVGQFVPLNFNISRQCPISFQWNRTAPTRSAETKGRRRRSTEKPFEPEFLTVT